MNNTEVILAILAGVIGFSALVVATLLLIISLIIRRVLLRVERMVMEVDDVGMRMMGESERMIALAKENGSLVMRFASGLAGVLLARHFVRAKPKKPKTHSQHAKQ